MVAYSFQKRFIGHVEAGLEPGPWCPGMKRHTLRLPRAGRSLHARPEQVVQLYTAMRTKHCRLIGRAVCRLRMPVALNWSEGRLSLRRIQGPSPRSYVAQLAPIVQQLLADDTGTALVAEDMDRFAQTDGFRDAAEMAGFFDAPGDAGAPRHLPLVLVAWAPGEPL